MISKPHNSALAVLRWLGGALIWVAHLLTVYGSESLICRTGEAGAHSLVVPVATTAALAALLILIAYGYRMYKMTTLQGAVFMEAVGIGLALLGLTGVLWTGAAGGILASCAR
jgi:hypothetical protein